MKRILSAIITVLFCVAIPLSAYCSDVVYEIPELFMAVTLPDSLTIFTRDVQEDNPGLSQFGFNADSLNETYAQQNIFLDAIEDDLAYEITISMVNNENVDPAFDLNYIDEKDDFITYIENNLKGQGATIHNSSMYQHKQALFAVFDCTSTLHGADVQNRIYCTIFNAQFISISLNSFSGDFSEQTSLLTQIIDSITFSGKSASFQTWIDIISHVLTSLLLAGSFIVVVIFIRKRKKRIDNVNKIDNPLS